MAFTAENVIHGRVLSMSGLRTRLQHRKVNARDREHRMPSLLVRLNIISSRQTAIQKIPPSPNMVIAFITGVSHSAFRAC